MQDSWPESCMVWFDISNDLYNSWYVYYISVLTLTFCFYLYWSFVIRCLNLNIRWSLSLVQPYEVLDMSTAFPASCFCFSFLTSSLLHLKYFVILCTKGSFLAFLSSWRFSYGIFLLLWCSLLELCVGGNFL